MGPGSKLGLGEKSNRQQAPGTCVRPPPEFLSPKRSRPARKPPGNASRFLASSVVQATRLLANNADACRQVDKRRKCITTCQPLQILFELPRMCESFKPAPSSGFSGLRTCRAYMYAKWLRIRPGQELTGNALLLHNGLLRSAHRCFFQGYTAGDCGDAVQPLAVHAALRENPVPLEPMVAQARLYDSYI